MYENGTACLRDGCTYKIKRISSVRTTRDECRLQKFGSFRNIGLNMCLSPPTTSFQAHFPVLHWSTDTAPNGRINRFCLPHIETGPLLTSRTHSSASTAKKTLEEASIAALLLDHVACSKPDFDLEKTLTQWTARSPVLYRRANCRFALQVTATIAGFSRGRRSRMWRDDAFDNNSTTFVSS